MILILSGRVFSSGSVVASSLHGCAPKERLPLKREGFSRARLLRGRALIGYASWRLFKFKTGESILNAAPSRASLDFAIIFLLAFSLPLFLSLSRLFLLCCQTTSPTRSFLAPLIPASCRSSLRPARPSKNSLTCLGVAYPFLPLPSSLLPSSPPLTTGLPSVHEHCRRGAASRNSSQRCDEAPSVWREREKYFQRILSARIKSSRDCVIWIFFKMHVYTKIYSKTDYYKKLYCLYNSF